MGPRATHHGVVITRVEGRDTLLLLADRRIAPYLDESDRERPQPDSTMVAANPGENCVAACARFGVEANLKGMATLGGGGSGGSGASSRSVRALHNRMQERIGGSPAQLPAAGRSAGSGRTAAKQWTCHERDIAFINNCDALLIVFPCQGGCGHQSGSEIPCYVSGTADTFQQCLVTDGAQSTCSASHPVTSRICPCVPSD